MSMEHVDLQNASSTEGSLSHTSADIHSKPVIDDGLFSCHHCTRRFRRREHLVRHQTCHTDEKPYTCPRCGKNFARNDALSRHVPLHEQDTRGRSRRDSTRACNACATSRIRCSRGFPCIHCNKRGRECVYPRPSTRNDHTSQLGTCMRTKLDSAQAEHNTGATPAIGIESSYAPDRKISNQFTVSPDASCHVEHQTLHYVDDDRYDVGAGTGLSSVYWWPTGLPDTENWILDQTLASTWQLPFPNTNVNIVQPCESNLNITETNLPLSNDREAVLSGTKSLFTNTLEHMTENIKIESPSPTLTPGKYYIDGAAGRTAFRGHHKITSSSSSSFHRQPYAEISDEVVSVDSFAETTNSSTSTLAEDDQQDRLSGQMYAQLVMSLREVLSQHSLAQNQLSFPTLNELETFIHAYSTRFHSVFPFLQRCDFQGRRPSWLVVLAVATVGAHLVKSQHCTYLHTLLAKVLKSTFLAVTWVDRIETVNETSHAVVSRLDNLVVVQAAILNVVIMLHNGMDHSIGDVLIERARLVECCYTMALLRPHGISQRHDGDHKPDTLVREWVRWQAELRAGLMIWLLDTIFAYETASAFRMLSVDSTILLPSTEALWENPTLLDVDREIKAPRFLLDCLETLWMKKEMPTNLTHFSHILLIHAIYRRVEDVRIQTKTRSWSFTPAPVHQTSDSAALLPQHRSSPESIYPIWRNSACDSLDVLHWSMNAEIAQCGGWEHPCVLYLHLSRLLLLSPVAALQLLAADSVVLRKSSSICQNDTSSATSQARAIVIRWALEDRFKARLSLIHAGALYWHVRRFGVDVITEPFGLYLATLVLWAYSVVWRVSVAIRATQTRDNPGQQDDVTDFPSGRRPPMDDTFDNHLDQTKLVTDTPFIYLDRPCDDEMVQNFVRKAPSMTAYLQSVGSITAPAAPKKILKEGIRLLGPRPVRHADLNTYISALPSDSPVHTWGVRARYVESLMYLETLEA